MNVKQRLSILFFLKRKKATKDGKIPIYVRITIDGQEDEFSLSCKVFPEHWNNERKAVSSADPDSETINKKIRQAETDLERHFDLVQAKNGLASPALVKESYLTPVCGQQIKDDNQKNRALCLAVDTLISKYLQYCKKVKKAWADGRTPSQGKQDEYEQEKKNLSAEIKEYAKGANELFDKATHQKTFMLTLNEYLLDFLQLALTGHRSPNTLEKWVGRKKKFKEFLAYRYKKDDIPLHDLQFTFVQEVFKYLLVEHEVIENTAMKYAQCVKDLMYRAVSKKWIPANVFCHIQMQV